MVSKHAFLHVICRDDMKTVRRPSDRHVNWRPHVQGKSPPVQVKEPYIRYSKWLSVGLHPATLMCTKYTCLKCPRGRMAVYRERLKESGFRKEDFSWVFTIYGHGSHLGHVTGTIWRNLHSVIPKRLYMKCGFNLPRFFFFFISEKQVIILISKWPWS